MENAEALLLEEFKRLHDLYVRSRVKRNERINFFVGLSTAMGSGLAILSQTKLLSSVVFQWLGFSSLALLGLLGIVVHRDLVRSEINSAVYLKSIDLIKYYFVRSNETLKQHLVFPELVDGASSFVDKKHFWSSTNLLFIQMLTALLWGSAVSIPLLNAFSGVLQWLTGVVFVVVGAFVVLLSRQWASKQLAKAEHLIAQISAKLA